MKVRYSEIQIHNGEVIVSRKSDVLEIGYSEAVINIQMNARKSYWYVLNTDDGVVHVTRQGLKTIWSVQVVTD